MQPGRPRDELNKTKYKQVFKELSFVDNILLKKDRIVIPDKLRPDLLALAHEGHPGRVSMLQQIKEDMWWPGITVGGVCVHVWCWRWISSW